MVEVKNGNLEGKGGLTILELEAIGVELFGIFKCKVGGVKMFMPPLVGCGYFLESPKLHECGCY